MSARSLEQARMQAYVVQEPFGIDALVRIERPVPEPGPRQVLVWMRAVSLRVLRALRPRLPLSIVTR